MISGDTLGNSVTTAGQGVLYAKRNMRWRNTFVPYVEQTQSVDMSSGDISTVTGNIE